MKKFNLNHSKTPPKLTEINQELLALLSSDELDDKYLRKLIELRDEYISAHLASLSEEDKKSFAECEIPVNTHLTEIVSDKLNASLVQLSGLLRGQKAVNKYK